MSAGDPRWLRRLDAIYALALRAYPLRFREEWEGELRQAFRDRCREVARGERRPLALLSEIVPDLAAGAGREHLLHLQDATMFKRNLAIALMLLFAALLVFQSRVGDAASAVQQWWTQRQERLVEASTNHYYVAVGDALAARAMTPRDQAIAALFHASAGDRRAQAQWDRAVAAGDRLALWISVTDCPVERCDPDHALAALTARDPRNAAVVQLRLDRAIRAGDTVSARAALRDLAGASEFNAGFAELTGGLLQAVEEVPVPARLRRYYGDEAGPEAVPSLLALGVGMRMSPLPSMMALPEYCKPPVAGTMVSDCLAAARILADGNELAARVLGLEVWRRLQPADGADSAELRQRIRDYRWLVAHADLVLGVESLRADIDGWREAWLVSRGEVEVYHRLMRDRGIPVRAPADFEVDPKYFDPGR